MSVVRNRALRRVKPKLLRALNREAFERDFLRQLPPSLEDAARLIFEERMTPSERALTERIEALRAEIASGARGVHGHISPHRGDVHFDDAGRLQPGALREQSPAELARVGVRPMGGVVLRRLVAGTGAKRVLELGTNTGLSGCYILDGGAALDTIEGSEELCAIAEGNLRRFSSGFRLHHGWFDDVMGKLIADGAKFDMVFVDGQHERVATEHYFVRSLSLTDPGALIVFDDIYWSDAMRQAWLNISGDPRVDLSVDLGERGLVRVGSGRDDRKVRLDLCDYIGRPEIVRHDY